MLTIAYISVGLPMNRWWHVCVSSWLINSHSLALSANCFTHSSTLLHCLCMFRSCMPWMVCFYFFPIWCAICVYLFQFFCSSLLAVSIFILRYTTIIPQTYNGGRMARIAISPVRQKQSGEVSIHVAGTEFIECLKKKWKQTIQRMRWQKRHVQQTTD